MFSSVVVLATLGIFPIGECDCDSSAAICATNYCWTCECRVLQHCKHSSHLCCHLNCHHLNYWVLVDFALQCHWPNPGNYSKWGGLKMQNVHPGTIPTSVLSYFLQALQAKTENVKSQAGVSIFCSLFGLFTGVTGAAIILASILSAVFSASQVNWQSHELNFI